MEPVEVVAPRAENLSFRSVGGAQPLILVPVRINERGPFEFILDTGAGTTLVAPHVAQHLDLRTTGTKEGQTAGGKINALLSNVASLQVGRARAKNLQVAITDLSPIGQAIGTTVDGDVGYNFLKGFCLAIDYANSTFALGRSPETHPADAKAEVKLMVANVAKPLILVAAHVNGRGPFQFAVDTGTSTTAISRELIRDLGISATAAPPLNTGAAQINVSSAQLQSLGVGAAVIKNIPVIVGDFLSMLSGIIGTKLDGILGYNFLRHFRVMIDYPQGLFRLE